MAAVCNGLYKWIVETLHSLEVLLSIFINYSFDTNLLSFPHVMISFLMQLPYLPPPHPYADTFFSIVNEYFERFDGTVITSKIELSLVSLLHHCARGISIFALVLINICAKFSWNHFRRSTVFVEYTHTHPHTHFYRNKL